MSYQSYTGLLSIMKLLIFTLLVGLSNAFTLPKIFKSGMVLQAEPTDAVIWGFLDGNTNHVDVYGLCSIKGKKFTMSKTFVPKEVLCFDAGYLFDKSEFTYTFRMMINSNQLFLVWKE